MEIFEKQQLKEGISRALIYLFVGFLLFSANFYLDANVLKSTDVEISETDFVFDYSKDLELPINGVLRFSSEEGVNNDFEEVFLNTDKREYVIRMNEGRLWGNFELSNAKVNIIVGNTVIVPDNSTFDLKFFDGKMEIATYNGETYLGFLNPGVSEMGFADQFSDRFMNVLLVARDTQAKLTVSKVNEDFSKLLPLKLAKSMDLYSAITSAMREEKFVSENLNKDLNFVESVISKVRMEFSSENYAKSSRVIGSFINLLKSNLTFVEDKSLRFKYDSALSNLNSAIYFAVNFKNAEMKEALLDFDLFVSENDLMADQEFLKIFNAYLDLLSVFKASDNEYLVLEHFVLLSNGGEFNKVYITLRALRRNVYNSMDFGDKMARESLKSYFEYFDLVISVLKKNISYAKFISFQNQILDNLLLRSYVFYSPEFFKIKSGLEEMLLSTISDEYLKNEYMQSFVSLKLDFLARAWVFLKSEKIGVEDASLIYELLLSDIKDSLSDEKLTDLAVLSLFKKQLEPIYDQYDYLKNVQYSSSALYGSTHEERFATYLKDRLIIPDLDGFLGVEEEVKTLDELKTEIVEVLSQSGINKVEFFDFENVNQRFLKISANISGYDFEAILDQDAYSFKDIKAYDELVSDSSVKISSLLGLFQRKFVEKSVEVPENLDVEAEIESHAQRVAKNFVKETLSKFDFSVELENISISNTDSTVFRLSDVYLAGNLDVVLTFDYVSTDETARNLYVIYEGKPVVLDGPYSLETLANLVLNKTDFSALTEEVLGESAGDLETGENTEENITTRVTR
ncbi:MAG: hypothetical protein RBS56_05080 [Candidatus Gracilibacteria bacterium]|jgi:hypothetical protein|nr:hypothetical protein [Candidatus Gracilibacteria bacterium]